MAKKPKRKPAGTPPTRHIIQIKCGDEWKAWLDRFGKFLRVPTSAIVDNALLRYAKETGFEESPPERIS